MGNLIIGFIVLCIVLALLKIIFQFAIQAFFLVVLILSIPALLPAYLLEKGLRPVKLRAVFFCFIVGFLFVIAYKALQNSGPNQQLSNGFSVWVYVVVVAFLAYIPLPFKVDILSEICVDELLESIKTKIFIGLYASAFAFLIAFFVVLSNSNMNWLAIAYYIGGVLGLGYCMCIRNFIGEFYKRAIDILSQNKPIRIYNITDELENDFNFLDIDIDELSANMKARWLLDGKIEIFELDDEEIIYPKQAFLENLGEVKDTLSREVANNAQTVETSIVQKMGVSQKNAHEFSIRYLEFGEYLSFSDTEDRFVCYQNFHKINTCQSCGHTEQTNKKAEGEWYCSDDCRQTEEDCLKISKQDNAAFAADMATNGLILMDLSMAWQENFKMFTPVSNIAHGIAAERGNHAIDRLSGRSAKLVGDDNAKWGPDRVVERQEIQTKYCKTPVSSVEAAFDNGQGKSQLYKYYDSNGQPMVLEVPKDQYEGALNKFKQKISEGKVPGVTDPNEAGKFVRKGSLTYQQAINMTKFCTRESLMYDAYTGVITGARAGGISFCLSASIYYYQTGDARQAAKAAFLQASKSFGRAWVMTVSTQQLEKVKWVYDGLLKIDITSMNKRAAKVLQKGLGATNTNQTNLMLRGTVVTSICMFAISMGPDTFKVLTGKISGKSFLQNVAINSTTVVGSAAGSIVGGFVGSAAGPVGTMVGRFVGGALLGGVANKVTSSLVGKMSEADAEKILELVERQTQYLAVSFMLTPAEITNLNDNLGKLISYQTLENIHNVKDRQRVAVNKLVKPLVVSITKQRPDFDIDLNDVVMLEQSEA